MSHFDGFILGVLVTLGVMSLYQAPSSSGTIVERWTANYVEGHSL